MLSSIFQTASRSRPLLVQHPKSSLSSLFHVSCNSFRSKFWPAHNPLLMLQPSCCFMGTKATIKTHKGAAKRFRVRGSGSIKRNKGGCSHNTGYKTRQRCNRLGQTDGIKEPSIEKRIRRLIAE